MPKSNDDIVQLLSSETVWAMHEPAVRALTSNWTSDSGEGGAIVLPPESKELAARSFFDGGGIEGEACTSVRIIPVMGFIRPRPTGWGGGFNLAWFREEFTNAIEDESVAAIVLDVDSPGGIAAFVQETADVVHAARGEKPIVAYTGGMAASAAYFIASAADRLVMHETADVGSIGMVATYVDWSKWEEKIGIKTIEFVSSQSPKKRLDPDSNEGRTSIQARIDEGARQFIERVATYRGVSTEKVEKEFGQGDLVVGEAAVSVGMADSVGTLDGVIEELLSSTNRSGHMSGQNTADDNKPASITKASVEIENPDIAAALRAEGAKAEGERLQAIDDQSVPGAEAIIAAAKADPNATAADVAMKIVAGMKDGSIKATSTAEAEDLDDDTAPPLAHAADNTGGAPQQGTTRRRINANAIYEQRRKDAANYH